jgi:SsrA-binding protein
MSRRGDQLIISNRKARYDYHVLDTFECGIVLDGAEVKSIRNGHANLQDGYARVDDGEVWLYGMHVKPYEFAHGKALDPIRKRKLLLHRKEIAELEAATGEKGVTSSRCASTSRTAGPRSRSRSHEARRATTSAMRSPARRQA